MNLSPNTPTPSTVLDILQPEQLDRLRDCFSEERLVRIARDAGVVPYPDGGGWIDFLIGHFFDPKTTAWKPADRERVLIAVFVARGITQGRFLPIHLYWGLMYLEPREIAETILLVGTYSGIQAHNLGLELLARTFTVLARAASGAPAPDVSVVLAALGGAFG